MERGWLDTMQLLGFDIALLVIFVLFALSAITARLALDPAEPAGRWLLTRLRARRPNAAALQSSELPSEVPERVAVRPAAPRSEEKPVTAEWLERLPSRREPRQQAPSPSSPATQSGVQFEEEVA